MADITVLPSAGILGPSRVILGIVHSCAIEATHAKLDVQYYTKDGALEVIDITTIQCLVARVKDRGQWAIVDRSGSLARALYIEGE